MADIKIKFSPRFIKVIKRIDDEFENNLSYKILGLIDGYTHYNNVSNIYYMDLSKVNNCFDIVIKGKKSTISIAKFANTYFPDLKITDHALIEFHTAYNSFKGEAFGIVVGTPIEHKPFVFNPKDVRSTFLSLVTKTYPMGHEKEVLQFLPKLDTDIHGNYYKIIPGDTKTMFTSHLDTADWKQLPTKLVSNMVNNEEFITTDGTSILGADDKAGVTIMLYMMTHNVPGLYYFFLGEERGGIGSGKVADDFRSFEFLKEIKKVISFDRRNYFSVITEQMGMRCCSNEFAESLCKELNKSGLKLNLDPTGVFTDSYNFVDYVPECTNVSVGYFNEHTHDEIQNMTYLERLAKACVSADWNKLTIKRKIGFDSEVLEKWSDLIRDLKESIFFNDSTIKGVEGKVVVSIEFDDVSLRNAYDDLSQIETILLMHRCNPDIKFDGNILKIQIG